MEPFETYCYYVYFSIPSLLLTVQWEPPFAVWYDLALSWCAMVSEVSRHGVQKDKLLMTQTTSHSSLLVALQGDVACKHNQMFLLVDSFNSNFFC